MVQRFILCGIFLLAAAGALQAQQEPDLSYNPAISRPAYKSGEGPRVAIDEAHFNFHTAEGRYKPFAELLRRDGYRVGGLGEPFSAASLKAVDVLVIANALNERNDEDWSLPTPSAFAPDEIAAVRAWVEKGGSLFLIADHMPFAGAAVELAGAFGVEFSNGYARPGGREPAVPDIFENGTGLEESAVTRGRSDDENVTKVATFTGSAFKPPKGAIPVLVFGAKSVSFETKEAPGITPGAPEVPIEGWCQGAVLRVGKGRVAVFGEAAMFSAQLAGPQQIPIGMNSPDAPQNYQLLLNVMHWLTGATGDELAMQVREAESAFAKTMAARDHAAFASHIADEAVFFGQQSVLRGRAAVAAGWKQFFEGDTAPFSWEPERVEVLDSGALAFSSGPVRDPEGRQIGTFNSVWRREADGRWKIVFDKGCPPCDCPPKP
jgi:ketosteroid isomerase-like protein